MSLNHTPSSERIHIGIFGRRNAGKSSLINALTNQELAIISDVKGTTTDPILKSMELLPLGPVVLIDTPGLDDTGSLGQLRIQKAYQMLNKTDLALLVIDATTGITPEDLAILQQIEKKAIPYVIVFNKCDLTSSSPTDRFFSDGKPVIAVSAKDHLHIDELKEKIASLIPDAASSKQIVGDLIHPLDLVLLVVPLDKAAPKGRLILPQQQTIRDILDTGACAMVVRDTEYSQILKKLPQTPALVITDSQVFAKISAETPADIPLTSFSILFARYKGNLDTVVQGAQALDTLKDHAHILICEGCTHHRQCDDIGTVKLPQMLETYTGKKLRFSFTSGTEFPCDLSGYQLIVHCGGCMLNEREMKDRLQCANDANIPITNYGIAIAHMQGILARSIEML